MGRLPLLCVCVYEHNKKKKHKIVLNVKSYDNKNLWIHLFKKSNGNNRKKRKRKYFSMQQRISKNKMEKRKTNGTPFIFHLRPIQCSVCLSYFHHHHHRHRKLSFSMEISLYFLGINKSEMVMRWVIIIQKERNY